MKTRSLFANLTFALCAVFSAQMASAQVGSAFGELVKGKFILTAAGGWWCPTNVEVKISDDNKTVTITDFATFERIGSEAVVIDSIPQSVSAKSYYDPNKRELIRLEVAESKSSGVSKSLNQDKKPVPRLSNTRSFVAKGNPVGLDLTSRGKDGKTRRICRYALVDDAK